MSNIDETPIELEHITNTALEKECTVSIKIDHLANLNKEYHVFYEYLEMDKRHWLCLHSKILHIQS